MKVMLIHPAKTLNLKFDYLKSYQPLFAAYLSSYLKNDNHEVKFLDVFAKGFNRRQENEKLTRIGLSPDEISKEIESFGPEVVGVSCIYTFQFPDAIEIVDIVKNVDPRIATVIGGNHITGVYKGGNKTAEDFANLNLRLGITEESIDYKVIGSGEIAMVNLVNSLKKGINPEKNVIGTNINLSNSLLPDFSIYEKNDYPAATFRASSGKEKFSMPYMSSRGCTNICDYCTTNMMWGRGFTHYTSEQNKTNLLNIKKQGYGEIGLHDDNMLLNKNYALELFEQIHSLDFEWTLLAIDRSRTDEKIIDSIIKNGCSHMFFSVETPNTKNLVERGKITYKNADNDKTIEHIKKLSENRISIEMDFMIGFPNETMKDIQRTVDYGNKLLEIGATNAIYIPVTPLPGTELYNKVRGKIEWEKGYDGFTLTKSNLNLGFDISKILLENTKYL
ncbi:MAG: radical SAM protein [archaeon]